MRKFMLIVLATAIAVSGCVAQKPAVEVERNRVHFASPNLTLELDSQFEYKGAKDKKDFAMLSEGLKGTGESRESHAFFKSGPDGERSWIHVDFDKLLTSGIYYRPIDFSKRKGLLQTGKTKLNGIEFTYAVYTTGGDESNDECYLRRVLAKRVGANNDKMVKIYYTEDIRYREDFPYRYQDWQDPAGLTQAQRARLEKFVDNGKREVKAVSP